MQCGSSVFQKHCQNVIRKLNAEDIHRFKQADEDETRVKELYNLAKCIPITLKEPGKKYEESVKSKTEGNSFFAKKDYYHALASYNFGILKCPQNEAKSKELLSVLISNRSATLFELKQYDEVLKDIEYLTHVGAYPENLLHKIWLRRAKCHDELQDAKLAVSFYEKTIEYLNISDLDKSTKLKKTAEIEKCIDLAKRKQNTCQEIVQRKSALSKSAGFDFVVHHGVGFDEDDIQGRFARALDDIDAGVTIVEEQPHCAVLIAEKALTNCQHCLTATIQPVACTDCAHVIFCSLKCFDAGLNKYHKYECKIQPTIFEYGASINCSMALRIITQRNLQYFFDIKKSIEKGSKSSKKKAYSHDNYENIYFLCRNEDQWKKEHLIHYTCMAIFLLRLLKTTDYFGSTDDDCLQENEAYIGSLILRHLQFLQFNAHEISQLTNDSSSLETYKSEFIGGGVYPTLALFNHSCDPSIVRYNKGSKMIARTIKPIKAGDIIYENYGPLYTALDKDERQSFLKERYWFECLCQPCTEMWPQLKDMDENSIRIPCKSPKCPKVFDLSKDIECPFLDCNICRQMTSVFPYLKGLMQLESILPIAEDRYKNADYEEAMVYYLQALKLYHKYSASPFPDLVKIQQRIKSCMVHDGNKCIGYKDPNKI